MSATLSHSSSILIVGAGTWGCSTALHLARRGYENVTVLDPYPVPSPISAGNDVNKVSLEAPYHAIVWPSPLKSKKWETDNEMARS